MINPIRMQNTERSMYKLSIKTAETEEVILSTVSYGDDLIQFARNWININGISREKVIFDVTDPRSHYIEDLPGLSIQGGGNHTGSPDQPTMSGVPASHEKPGMPEQTKTPEQGI